MFVPFIFVPLRVCLKNERAASLSLTQHAPKSHHSSDFSSQPSSFSHLTSDIRPQTSALSLQPSFNVPVPEMVGLVYPAEVTFWIELGGLRVSVATTAISGCAACQQLHAGCYLYYLHLRSNIYLFHIALFYYRLWREIFQIESKFIIILFNLR